MKKLKLELFLIILASITRLIPHPWNFTPLGGFALFAGANRPMATAWLVPIATLLFSNLVLGFYNPVVMVFVYLGFLAAPFIGRWLLARDWKQGRWLGAAGASALVFYLLSNFGVWAAGFYPPTFAGLIAAYVVGLPFLAISFAGDAFYTFALFKMKDILEERGHWIFAQ